AAFLGTAVAADEKDKEKILFEDKFGAKLADGWSWVREDPKAWKLDKGALLIRTSTGGLWMKDNNCQNVLLRTPPEIKEAVVQSKRWLRMSPATRLNMRD